MFFIWGCRRGGEALAKHGGEYAGGSPGDDPGGGIHELGQPGGVLVGRRDWERPEATGDGLRAVVGGRRRATEGALAGLAVGGRSSRHGGGR